MLYVGERAKELVKAELRAVNGERHESARFKGETITVGAGGNFEPHEVIASVEQLNRSEPALIVIDARANPALLELAYLVALHVTAKTHGVFVVLPLCDSLAAPVLCLPSGKYVVTAPPDLQQPGVPSGGVQAVRLLTAHHRGYTCSPHLFIADEVVCVSLHPPHPLSLIHI